MKKLATLMLGVVLFAGVASAGNAWGPVVSYWDTADGSAGAGWGAVFSFDVSPTLALDLRYASFDDLSDASSADVSDVDIKVEPIEVGFSVVRDIGKASSFHIGGGIGYYMVEGSMDAGLGVVTQFDPDDELGAYAVLGFDVMLVDDFAEGIMAKGMTLFVEGIYRVVSIDEATTGAVGQTKTIQNGDLGGVGANVGVRFLW